VYGAPLLLKKLTIDNINEHMARPDQAIMILGNINGANKYKIGL